MLSHSPRLTTAAAFASASPRSIEIANCRNFKLFCFAVPRRLLPIGFFGCPRLNLSKTEAGRALSRTLRGYAELCLSSREAAGASAHGGLNE
jgi:AraC family transcriptional regulator, positive regulator of tynA and feaB